ncbi:ParB/RepB/Spo0J family partition protein [Aureimonas pseudogalii]|uniref:ParB family chromosome partitioning protein n=1 Tax=Aureimonas pseudogalii TaxID=1744844 RepID=A0A7W6H309_9HYPH|nr:ParB/RepB/Spo0J family partition protein [Aureimonas pseudogalii]MBB3997546.1 ParB family chromosome partitioning protein [Aureimonas pseudogalii]
MNDDKARQRLGRGLASLIGGSSGTLPARAGGGFPLPSLARTEDGPGGERRVPVGDLGANPRNPRRSFGEAELAELTASIRHHGVVQPILVRRTAAGAATRYEIVAGERRWRASQAAGLKDVPVVVREITDRESLEIAIIENVQRADLDAIEEALGYEMLMAEYGYTQADLGDVLGKSRSHVANTLRLLKLPESVKAMVSRGELSAGAARTAIAQGDPEAFARRIVEGGLSVREAETMARGGPSPVEPPAPAAPGGGRRSPSPSGRVKPMGGNEDADTQALERLLSDAIGLGVTIDMAGTGGTMRIDFRNLDDLDAICRRLQTRAGSGEDGPRIRSL